MLKELMKDRKAWRVALSLVLLLVAMWVERIGEWCVSQLLVIYAIPYLLISYDILLESVEEAVEGEIFGEDLLMSIATLAALFIGFLPAAEPQMAEAVWVMWLFQVGEMMQDYAEDHSRRSISELLNIRPDEALVELEGRLVTMSAREVQPGQVIVVKAGGRIALDGKVIEGHSELNTVALTGESMPREVKVGDTVYTGCINMSGLLRVKVETAFAQSTASRIIEMVEHARDHQSKSETFIRRFARVYTPSVVVVALLLAFVPPLLLTGAFGVLFADWVTRALTFLVASCPCALVISIPLTFFAGIGGASRQGILFKGGNYMDAMSKAHTVVFDKTGTLTRGEFGVEAIHPEKEDEDQLLHLAAHVERYSTHPIAVSLKEAYEQEDDGCEVKDVREIPGAGVTAMVNGQSVSVGNETLMADLGVTARACHLPGTIAHVALDNEYAGHIVIADRLKEDAASSIRELRSLGVKQTVMLTGDAQNVAEYVASQLDLDEVKAQLLPQDKLAIVEQLMCRLNEGQTLLMVGDGINDSPVLARAHVGIAMGAMGADAAIEAADVVLMNDQLSALPQAIWQSRRTVRIARENAVFAISFKVMVLIMAVFGVTQMWMAVFADVGVTLLATINAMRAMHTGKTS